MASLVLSLEGDIIQEIALDKPRISIGRRAQHDIRIDNIAISGDHAVIVQEANRFYVEDNGSTNGTLINGTPVTRNALYDNDVIQIGKYHLKFFAHGTPPSTETEFAKTLLVRSPFAGKQLDADAIGTDLDAPTNIDPFPSTFSPELKAHLPQPLPDLATAQTQMGVHAHRASLRILTSKQAGKEIPIDKPMVSIGKKGVQVALITHKPTGYFISHVQGGRYPIINGVTINDNPCPLSHGDLLELSGIKMEFLIN